MYRALQPIHISDRENYAPGEVVRTFDALPWWTRRALVNIRWVELVPVGEEPPDDEPAADPPAKRGRPRKERTE